MTRDLVVAVRKGFIEAGFIKRRRKWTVSNSHLWNGKVLSVSLCQRVLKQKDEQQCQTKIARRKVSKQQKVKWQKESKK